MEIVSPTNGQILEASTLHVIVRLHNFVMPYTGRQQCIGLSTQNAGGNERKEHCIQQVKGPHKISGLLVSCILNFLIFGE
jgi:hypothetical protein